MNENTILPIKQETQKILTMTQDMLETLISREEKNYNANIKTKTLSIKNLTSYRSTLKNELQKLKNLEYVIAVVGTMKSGKSMTINAIVGQEILPSREFPMTTLPTLITHIPNKTTPTLTIKKIAPFNRIKDEIKEKLQNDTSVISSLGEIKELGERIKNNEITFKQDYQGQEDISNFLKDINDLMRIAKELDINPPYAEYTDVDDLPRIEVEFYHLKKHNQEASNARLTLLDTPGPDEVKQSAELKVIFEQQLQRASAVTLVVDYTKMNNESDADVKEQVKSVADMLGKKHLFVLLNKFDQRKRKKDNEESSKEEAKRLITEEILKDKIKDENVFPISSKYAFYANLGLRELEHKQEIHSELSWVEEFGTTILGEDWEDDIDDVKRIEKKCNSYWEKSFFEKPLNNIISSIHNEASFMALDSPLSKMKSIHQELYNAFNIQENAYHKDIQELRETVISLESSVNILNNITNKVSEITKRKVEKSKQKLEDDITQALENISKDINKYFDEGLKSQKNKSKENIKNHTNNSKFNNFLNTKLWEGGLFGGTKDSKKKEEDFETLRKEGKVSFNCENEANQFVKEIIKSIENIIKEFYSHIEEEFNCNVKSLSTELNEFIEQELHQIIEEIKHKLGNNIEITLPSINIKSSIQDLNISDDNFIQKDNKPYEEVGDSWFSEFKNWLNNDWGKTTEYIDIFVIEKNEILITINKELEKNKTTLIFELDNLYKEKITSKIENEISILLKKLMEYQGEQSFVLEEYKQDGFDLKKKKLYINENKKIINKLSNRRETTIKQLEEYR